MSLIGKTVGNYAITKLLGEGGMGAVYLAEHPVIGKKVALKVLHLEMAKDPEIVARFFNEARAIHTIGHPNIVDVLDFGQTPDGYPYFIMEYLRGQALADRIAGAAMEPSAAAKVAGQICSALQAAHEKGIVHRDLKPQNVFVLQDVAGEPLVKILDFGVAKVAQGPDSAHSVKTRTGSLMGTPLYMSPEQCRGAGGVDHRADIYALGVIAYEMIAGRPPFVGEGVGELFAKHMIEAPRPLAEVVPGVPAPLAAAIAKALSKRPEDRHANMNEFRAALLGEAAPAAVPTPTAPAPAAAAKTKILNAATRLLSAAPSHPVVSARLRQPHKTTLSSVVSEIGDEEGRPAADASRWWRRGKGVLIAGGAAAAVVVALAVARGGAPEPPAAPAKPIAAAAAPATTVKLDTEPTHAPGPRMVRIELDSLPGTHVIRKTDGKDLGPVPVALTLPADGGKPEYVFRLAGYEEVTQTVELTGDQTLRIVLLKAAAPAPRAASPPVRRRPSPRAPSVETVPDRDALAKPSF